jgi:hypothetical protein
MVFFTGYSLLNLNNPDGFQVPVDFHVYFSHKEELGVSKIGDNESSVFSIDYALGNVKLSNIPYSFLTFYSFIAIVLSTLILLLIRLTLKILKTVRKQLFFIVENAIRLRWIALLTIAVFLTDRISAVITSSYLSNQIEFPGIEFTGFNLYTITGFEIIFNALFLLVIAEIFRIGAKLKEEHDLTI